MKHAVQLFLAVVAVAGAQAHAADPEPLQPGSQVRGEITLSAPLNHSDGSRSRLYTVEIGERELVGFDVSGPLRAQLSLFDGDELVASSGDREPASLALRAPRSAAYTLAVSSADAAAFGPYTLSTQVIDGWDGQPLRAGARITDWLDGSRELALQVDREGMYTIDLSSDQFDTVLEVSGEGVSARDDDGGDGTNSRLALLLSPGTYTVTAGGWGGGGQGLYRMEVERRAVPDGLSQGGRISAGSSLQGAFQGAPLEYGFRLRERSLVTIDMRSSDFDSLLLLSGPGVERHNDDGGEGLDAKLVQVLEPGEYVIQAGAATDGSGLFTLALATAAVPEGMGGGSLAVGQEHPGVLLAGAADRFVVTVEEEAEYVIDMASQDFDSYLELFDADGMEIAADDDSGGMLDARIRTRLAPGEYVIQASAIGDGAGSYRMTFSQR